MHACYNVMMKYIILLYKYVLTFARMSISAPEFIKSWTMPTSPFKLAKWRAVKPICVIKDNV